MACIRRRRGKWVVDYRDRAGIRRWKTCATKREAEDFLDVERPKTRQWSQPTVNHGIKVRDYAEHWLDLIKSTVKARTHIRYKELLELRILPAFGDVKVQQLHRGRIKGFLAAKLTELKPSHIKSGQEHKPRKGRQLKEPRTLARNTVRNIHATLRAMLKAAVDDGVLQTNPAEKLGRQLRLITPTATRREEIKAMTRQQRRVFLETAARETPRYYPFFFALAGTGMRLGEALALQWSDVNVLNREITVLRAFSARKLDTPKSGHGRAVDMSHALAETLAHLEIERKAEALKNGWPQFPPWVFCTKDGAPLDDWNLRTAMMAVLKKAGLPLHFTPHCLRHTYASLMLQQGESPAYVQRQLGHASIQLTVDTYGKWLPMGNKAAVERLDAVAAEPSGSKMVATGDELLRRHSLKAVEGMVKQEERVVPPTRIERATNGLGNRCSIRLSYGGTTGR